MRGRRLLRADLDLHRPAGHREEAAGQRRRGARRRHGPPDRGGGAQLRGRAAQGPAGAGPHRPGPAGGGPGAQLRRACGPAGSAQAGRRPRPNRCRSRWCCRRTATSTPCSAPARSVRRWPPSASPTCADATGCCGVAGNFGFEKEHYEVSMQVAEQALAPALREHRRGVRGAHRRLLLRHAGQAAGRRAARTPPRPASGSRVGHRWLSPSKPVGRAGRNPLPAEPATLEPSGERRPDESHHDHP